MIVFARTVEIKVLEKRTGMTQGVSFERNALFEEPLHVGMFRIGPVARDADCPTAIDDLQPLDDGRQVVAEMLSVSRHVIDGKNDYSLNALFANPLGGNKFGRLLVELPGIVRFVKVSQPVARFRECREDKLDYGKAEKGRASEGHRAVDLENDRRLF